jgi:hypothetical protein
VTVTIGSNRISDILHGGSWLCGCCRNHFHIQHIEEFRIKIADLKESHVLRLAPISGTLNQFWGLQKDEFEKYA